MKAFKEVLLGVEMLVMVIIVGVLFSTVLSNSSFHYNGSGALVFFTTWLILKIMYYGFCAIGKK
jgi:hypothetical protein